MHVSSALPFIGLLLSIGLIPLLFPRYWKTYDNAIIGFWFVLAVVFTTSCSDSGLDAIFHTLIYDYVPFITVVSSLYLVSTGITVTLSFPPKPHVTTLFLLVATLCASFLGTTGTTMLFIQPLLKLIKDRTYKKHIVMFFIFLVANCGGCLTPLGDPPLLMGFLYGVPFSWPFFYLFWPFAFTVSVLLCMFYVLELYLTRKKHFVVAKHFHVHGVKHIIMLLSIALVGALLPELYGLSMMVVLAFISVHTHRHHDIHWAPVLEVAKIFCVVFVAIIPILHILDSDSASAVKAFVNNQGQPNPFRYFWLSGFFSSFLDNAPTYVIFFKMTGKSVCSLIAQDAQVLRAISLGSVFMGAITYLGNAPNLMIRSIAEDKGFEMPSFFAYIGYSCLVLLPVFYVMCLIFF